MTRPVHYQHGHRPGYAACGACMRQGRVVPTTRDGEQVTCPTCRQILTDPHRVYLDRRPVPSVVRAATPLEADANGTWHGTLPGETQP